MNRLSRLIAKKNMRHFCTHNPLSDKRPIMSALWGYEFNLGIYDDVWRVGNGNCIKSRNPFTNEINSIITTGDIADYKEIIQKMYTGKKDWMNVPMPQRGEIVRQIGIQLRENKEQLAHLITLETGKIKTEALGEVQEAIDICDYAVGLSRMPNGSIIPSERTDYQLMLSLIHI